MQPAPLFKFLLPVSLLTALYLGHRRRRCAAKAPVNKPSTVITRDQRKPEMKKPSGSTVAIRTWYKLRHRVFNTLEIARRNEKAAHTQEKNDVGSQAPPDIESG
ncbi:hypothetical protein B0H19DRAFT_1232774 [Mycena capillaripes]|nr:hypothetical protein B0H19DRAFT_1232774 [Mycena capillaripes]